MAVFHHLHAEEDEPEQESQREEDFQDAAMAALQRVVRDRDGQAGSQEQRGVDRRQAECR